LNQNRTIFDKKLKLTLTLCFFLSCLLKVSAENNTDLKQVLIPSGTFLFGCSAGDSLCDPDEGTQGGIELEIPAFYIDISEVSVAEYKACADALVCEAPFNYKRTHYCNYDAPRREDYPVNCVNWQQAKNYCEWRGARLPFEVEWEKAARGGTLTPYPWGHEPASCERAVMDPGTENDQDTETDGCWRDLSWPRNSFAPNPYGLFDMVGGTSEWVADWYDQNSHTNYHAKGKVTGPLNGQKKVIKGGSWDEKHGSQRVSNRYAKPIVGNPDLYGSNGFRCVTPLRTSLEQQIMKRNSELK
jgi:iron(II)-dependent oxidoreductase